MGISLNNLPGAVDVSQEDNNDDDTSLYVGNPYIEKKWVYLKK